MGASKYYEGSQIDLFTRLANSAGVATDPSALTLTYKPPGSGAVTLTYSGLSIPTTNQIWRTDTGAYTARIATVGFNAGAMAYAWHATGAVESKDAGEIVILADPTA